MNSTARVSATVAVAGGLAAAVAVPQSADAATGSASLAGAHTVDFAAIGQRAQAVAHPLAATHAQQQLSAVAAKPQLATPVHAASYVAPKKVVRPKTSSVSRSATRTAPVHHATPVRRATVRHTTTVRHAAPVRHTTPVSSPTPPASSAPQSTSGIVSIAKQFIGTPYVYGGSSPSGFDCSGFTSYVYRMAGKSIPRTATAQMNSVTRVSDPQPGDLVFFGSGSYAYHVGIYLGGGMMIDAPHPGASVHITQVYTTPAGYGRL